MYQRWGRQRLLGKVKNADRYISFHVNLRVSLNDYIVHYISDIICYQTSFFHFIFRSRQTLKITSSNGDWDHVVCIGGGVANKVSKIKWNIKICMCSCLFITCPLLFTGNLLVFKWMRITVLSNVYVHWFRSQVYIYLPLHLFQTWLWFMRIKPSHVESVTSADNHLSRSVYYANIKIIMFSVLYFQSWWV